MISDNSPVINMIMFVAMLAIIASVGGKIEHLEKEAVELGYAYYDSHHIFHFNGEKK